MIASLHIVANILLALSVFLIAIYVLRYALVSDWQETRAGRSALWQNLAVSAALALSVEIPDLEGGPVRALARVVIYAALLWTSMASLATLVHYQRSEYGLNRDPDAERREHSVAE